MKEEINDLKRYVSLTGNKLFATFKIENISNIIMYCEQLQQENKRLNGAIQTYDILLKANVEDNRQLKNDINKLQKELNEENLQCSKYSIEFNNLKEKNKELKDNWNKLKKDLELVVDYGLGDESSKWDKIYGEYAKSTLKFMQELEQGSDSNE